MKNGYEENGNALLKILTLYYIVVNKGNKCLKGSWKENKFDSWFEFVRDSRKIECKLAFLESLKDAYM
jgi:hypothetical protein